MPHRDNRHALPIGAAARPHVTRGLLLVITGVLCLLALGESQDHSNLRTWFEVVGMVGGFSIGFWEIRRGLAAEFGWPL